MFIAREAAAATVTPAQFDSGTTEL